MNAPLLIGYRLLPRLFDRVAAPLVKLIGFTRRREQPDSGNTGA